MQDRMPPQNIEAEQSVLGAMLIEKEAISKISEVLKVQDFYREANRLVFQAIIDLFNRNDGVDLITVTEELRRENKLEAAGGIAYITSLANAMPTAANVLYHAKIVEEKALLRNLINVSTQIAGMGYDGAEDVTQILDKSEKMMLEVANRRMGRDFTPIKEILFSDKMLFSTSTCELLLNNIKFLKSFNTSTHAGFAHL